MAEKKLEDKIAEETEAGREMLELWHSTLQKMPGAVKLQKALEMTDHVRAMMRAGIRHRNPDLSETELQTMYVERLLEIHGWSLEEIRRRQVKASKPQ